MIFSTAVKKSVDTPHVSSKYLAIKDTGGGPSPTAASCLVYEGETLQEVVRELPIQLKTSGWKLYRCEEIDIQIQVNLLEKTL